MKINFTHLTFSILLLAFLAVTIASIIKLCEDDQTAEQERLRKSFSRMSTKQEIIEAYEAID